MKRVFLFAAMIAALSVAGCTSVGQYPSVFDREMTPRQGGIVLQQDTEPLVESIALTFESLPEGVRDAVCDYGPTIRTAIGSIASRARACVVVNGALRADPAAGEPCIGADVTNAYRAFANTLYDVGLAVGGETAPQLTALSILAASFINRTDGGLINGYQKELDDVPLEVYDRAWQRSQRAADLIQAKCTAIR